MYHYQRDDILRLVPENATCFDTETALFGGFKKSLVQPGIEPGISRTQGENQTPSLLRHWSKLIHCIIILSPVYCSRYKWMVINPYMGISALCPLAKLIVDH